MHHLHALLRALCDPGTSGKSGGHHRRRGQHGALHRPAPGLPGGGGRGAPEPIGLCDAGINQEQNTTATGAAVMPPLLLSEKHIVVI